LLIETGFAPCGQLPFVNGATIRPVCEDTHALTVVESEAATAIHAPPATATAQIGTTTTVRTRAVMPRIMLCSMPCR
jgi:hypothetical protein